MWTVTRQCQWPDGDLVVEVSEGGLDYTNPGALCARYEGEFETFDSKVEAVTTAIKIAKAWQIDSPDEEIEIATGGTMGFTMPFPGEPLNDEIFAGMLQEAQEVDDALPKCDHCATILGRDKWKNENSSWSGCVFCSENCANVAQEFDEREDAELAEHEEV